jgi:hypothetical protein
MAYEIKSESYGRRLPKITATADSTDDLSTLGTDWAEGSTCVISDTTYKLDKVKGWVDPSSGGGGGGGGLVVETEWVAGSGDSEPYFKSNVLGTALRAAITSGQNVVVHIPGKTDYSIGELYFTPILELTDASGQADIVYRLPYDKSGSMPWSNLLDGDDDNEGYVQFRVYVD